MLAPPFDAEAEERGSHEIAFIGDALDLPYSGLGANAAFINAHRPEAVAAIRALMDANRRLKDGHLAEAAGQVVEHIGAQPATARRSVEKMVPLLSDTGELSSADAQQAIDIQAELTRKAIDGDA